MSNKRPFVLGLDLDNATLDYTGGFRRFVSEKTGTPPEQLPAPKNWSYVQSGWPLRDEKHFLETHTEAVRAGMFRDLEAYAGASEALWDLSNKGVYIRIVTHRLATNFNHQTAAADTLYSLDTANIPFRDICFVANKVEVAANCWLDDAPHNVTALREAGNTVIVADFDPEATYNRHLDGLRATDWTQVHTLVLERFNAHQDQAA